jgi:hypothetical protein
MIDFTQDFAYACRHPRYGPLPVAPGAVAQVFAPVSTHSSVFSS